MADFMNISALSNANLAQVSSNMQREQDKTSSFQDALDKAVKEKDEAELKTACREMEAYFIQMMFKEMRKTVHSENGVVPKSFTEEIFQEMLDEQYAKDAAKSGGIGLADMMYKQLSRNL